jgi:hypothetical protein
MDATARETDDPDAVRVHGLGVRFFPYSSDINDEINAWADEQGARVLKTVPVYFEDPHERRRTK